MRPLIDGVDHVVICVSDLEAAAARYASFGFSLTPRGRHDAGTENHCAMFAEAYLELYTVPESVARPNYYRDFVERGDGVAAIALATSNASGVREALVGSSFAPAPIRRLSRPTDGGVASFTLCVLSDGTTPPVRTFFCEHETRHLVWQPHYQEHPNGATAIRRIFVAADAPSEAARPFVDLFQEPARASSEGLVVDTGRVAYVFAERARIDDRLAGSAPSADRRHASEVVALEVSVRDRRNLDRVLASNGVAHVSREDATVVATGHGVSLLFTQDEDGPRD